MTGQETARVRMTTRLVTDIEATWDAHGLRGRAQVYNISVWGCMIEAADERLFAGDTLALSMPKVPSIDGSVVWQDGPYAGIQFREPLDQATVNELGFKEPEADFTHRLPQDRFGRTLPVRSGRLPF